MPDVVMTNHSVKRTKERIGLSKKIADKNAQRALEYGITHSEARVVYVGILISCICRMVMQIMFVFITDMYISFVGTRF